MEVMEVRGEALLLLSWPTKRHPATSTLTPVERDIVQSIAAGRSNAEIARLRGTSVRTVANQVATLRAKFGVASRYALPGAIGASGA